MLYSRIRRLHIGPVIWAQTSTLGCNVKKFSVAMALTIPLVTFVSSEIGLAADAEPIVRQKTARHYRVVEECGLRHCPPRCPDRYSCAPLYGAYGPWRGERYWASYSYTLGPPYTWGWGY